MFSNPQNPGNFYMPSFFYFKLKLCSMTGENWKSAIFAGLVGLAILLLAAICALVLKRPRS
jgi:hypothetical protein